MRLNPGIRFAHLSSLLPVYVPSTANLGYRRLKWRRARTGLGKSTKC